MKTSVQSLCVGDTFQLPGGQGKQIFEIGSFQNGMVDLYTLDMCGKHVSSCPDAKIHPEDEVESIQIVSIGQLDRGRRFFFKDPENLFVVIQNVGPDVRYTGIDGKNPGVCSDNCHVRVTL